MYKDIDLSSHLKFKTIYSVFKQRIPSNYYYDGERHKMWEFVIVTDGKIGVTAGCDALILKKGQAIIHEPWEFHRIWGEECEAEFIIFTFTADTMPTYTSKIFDVEDIEKIDSIVNEIISVYAFKGHHITHPLKDCEIKCQIAIKKLEIFLLETISQKAITEEINLNKTARSYAMTVNLLENNLDKNLSLDEIARLCNMSKSNLSKIFLKYSGMGVISYYNQMKINYSISMLKSNMSIKEISEKLGFENQNYFCTVFKKIKGKAPSHYR